MHRIVLACKGVPTYAGAAGARDISNEFAHRPWHANVTCVRDGSQLFLQADNDFDSNGLALVDEFSDAISTCIEGRFDGNIEVLSMRRMPGVINFGAKEGCFRPGEAMLRILGSDLQSYLDDHRLS